MKKYITFFLFCISGIANASLVTPTTFTDSTGVEWLKLDNTLSMGHIEAGNTFKGFTYASNSQVMSLMNLYFSPTAANGAITSGLSISRDDTAASIQMYIDFGGNIERTGAMGKYFDEDNIYKNAGTQVLANGTRQIWGAEASGNYSFHYNYGSPHTGIFMVKNTELSAVPVPAAVWLMGSGLLGLFSLSRNRKNQVVKA